MSERPNAESIERYGYKQELHRSLSFTDLLVYGLVFMVPIAPFGIFGSVFQGSGGSRWPAPSTPTRGAVSRPLSASCRGG